MTKSKVTMGMFIARTKAVTMCFSEFRCGVGRHAQGQAPAVQHASCEVSREARALEQAERDALRRWNTYTLFVLLACLQERRGRAPASLDSCMDVVVLVSVPACLHA